VSWLGPRSVDGGVDRIPLPRGPGTLWLCGKHAVGADPEGALQRVAASTMVCLNERHELDARYPGYVAWLEVHRGTRALWVPIPDLHVPRLPQLRSFLAELVARLDRGDSLLMHCGAGIGRAGTVATCVLMEMGTGPDDALRIVAEHRPLAGPEAGAQHEAVRQLAAELAAD
jgi:protein-tyrosine phosphatase